MDAAVPLVDPSIVTEVATTAEQILQPVKEIPFSELGLGGFSPIGLLQQALEFLHMSVGLPWWAAIAAGELWNEYQGQFKWGIACPFLGAGARKNQVG